MDAVVHISSISKNFGAVEALKEVSFEVNQGELFGLIGPDGAGKTTLFRILNTLLIPDAGKATVLGRDAVEDYEKIRPLLGYMPGSFSLYQDLTVEENLAFFATVFGTTIEENYELVKPIYQQLEMFKDRLAGNLSGGMKQKLALSCALIHKPQLLLLDEPTTGVDAVSRKEFWDMLKLLKSDGITIIVSTPYMDEADLCDRVALMQSGEIMQIDAPRAIVQSQKQQMLGIRSSNMYALMEALKAYSKTNTVYLFGASVHYSEKDGKPNKEALLQYLKQADIPGIEIQDLQPNIEDTFMWLMGTEEQEHV